MESGDLWVSGNCFHSVQMTEFEELIVHSPQLHEERKILNEDGREARQGFAHIKQANGKEKGFIALECAKSFIESHYKILYSILQ